MKNPYIFRSFYKCCWFKARGVAEISDRSTIFGLWCHMSRHMQLYAYMTLISENMIKNAKNVPKIRFLELKCSKNDISKLNMMLCLGIKNHEKMILAWLFYPTASFGIIVQNSSIGQKFRQLRAPKTGNICWNLEKWAKI